MRKEQTRKARKKQCLKQENEIGKKRKISESKQNKLKGNMKRERKENTTNSNDEVFVKRNSAR